MAAYEGTPETTASCTREAFAAAVRFAVSERVDLLLIAGDIYDGDWQDFSTGVFFASQLSALREAGIPVIVIRGNHDAASVISRELPLPEGTTVLSHEQPQTVVLEDLGVAVHGQSFATREVSENLSVNYPRAIPAMLNIGLLHTSLAGHPDHDTYAPCSGEDLERRGYDYWALGHIHEPGRVGLPAFAYYAGCVQGRSVRECGPRGGLLVELQEGEEPSVRHVSFDVLRWAVGEIDCSPFLTFEDLRLTARERLNEMVVLAEDRPVACRLRLVGESALHNRLLAEGERVRAELITLANDVAAEAIWLGSVSVMTEAISEHDSHGDPELASVLEEVLTDTETRAQLQAMLEQVRTRVPEALIVADGPLAVLGDSHSAIERALELARARLALALDPPPETGGD
jgi:DNA repair exonuclease SbcCD nuclease subunit